MAQIADNFLRLAQFHLNEYNLRTFWQAMTQKYNQLCIHGGISLDWDITDLRQLARHVAEQLSCAKNIMACPVYIYNYDFSFDPPHHMTALTMIRDGDILYLTYFNPKSTDHLENTQKENQLFQHVATLMKSNSIKTNTPLKKVIYRAYNSVNLQKRDYIGSCQLYSLFYLDQFCRQVHQPRTDAQNQQLIQLLTQPNQFVSTFRNQMKSADLVDFFIQHFTQCSKTWCLNSAA
jgi:hypothetical protein